MQKRKAAVSNAPFAHHLANEWTHSFGAIPGLLATMHRSPLQVAKAKRVAKHLPCPTAEISNFPSAARSAAGSPTRPRR
jgi:hypothetical protein